MVSPEQVTAAIQTIDQLSSWLENAGLTQVAIAQFKFNSLAAMYPELKEVAEIAKSLIGATFPITEEGMTVTELAGILTESLGKNVKPEQVNQALVTLGYQERNEAKRTWSLTEAGQEHGISLLATSTTNSWSGVQVKWRRSVISILLNYFQASSDQSTSITKSDESYQEISKEVYPSNNGNYNNNAAANDTSPKAGSKRKKAWTVADRIKDLGLKSNPTQIELIQSFADEFYSDQYGTKPSKLSGRRNLVSSYPSEALSIVYRAIETVFNPKKKSES
ncbi:MAG TPA: hypothetical protein DDW76_05555 [Cyanobacteria bacterium UBA11369]|nr:hypothetical protein [Cyanobacteria bacterium UBA11371]HBE36687.1 hypothetical protein [Cyanobacteria bacterium UBA11368]HBE48272.1 hypothetical protein [Cyanobacteria bacterium UBA11369]